MPHLTYTYYSLDDLYVAADNSKYRTHPHNLDRSHIIRWAGGTLDEALEMLRMGDEGSLTEASQIVTEALKLIDTELEVPTIEPLWDVTGSEVDVGRFTSGVPECMVEYEPVTISRVGKTVTLCASTMYSASLSHASIVKRGAAIVGLALALERSGHAVELWADMSTHRHAPTQNTRQTLRVRVKGPNDIIDPARIAYVYMHPTMLRQLCFAVGTTMPYPHAEGLFEMPINPEQDLPEGTIYLPTLKSGRDVPDADRLIRSTLENLGLLTN